MAARRFVVTGGAGFIGSHFVDLLTSKMESEVSEIVVVDKLTYAGSKDNLKSAMRDPRVKFFELDICDRPNMEKLILDGDCLVNFAAESHVDRSILDSRSFIESNIVGVHTLLEASRNKKSLVFVQISTDEVYGSLEFENATEDYPFRPSSPYSASKAAAEHLCQSYSSTYDMNVITTRCGNNYGERQYPEKLIPVIIEAVMRRKDIPIYGTGLNIRNWIHVGDHVRGVYAAIEHAKQSGVYNFSSNDYFSNLEIAHFICELFAYDKSNIVYTADRLGHDFRYGIDSQRSRNDLMWTPEVSFADGLRSLVTNLQSHPQSHGVFDVT